MGEEHRIVGISPCGDYLLGLLLSTGEYVYVDTRRHLSSSDFDIIASNDGSFAQVVLDNDRLIWPEGVSVRCDELLVACAPTSREALGSTADGAHLEPLARIIAFMNNEHFLPQFTYPVTKFELSRGQTRELADHLVLVKGRGILFQLKQRSTDATGSLREWFENKVKKKGKVQIRNSLKLLKVCREIPATNSRGRRTVIQTEQIRELHSVICFQIDDAPCSEDFQRWIVSGSAGFVHIFDMNTYGLVLSRLVTLSEVLEYLAFREGVVLRWHHEGRMPSEPALLGQFIHGDDNARPSEDYAAEIERASNNRDEFDLSYFLKEFERDMPSFDPEKNEHEEILAEFALLNRTELGEIRKRLLLCLKYSASDEDLFTCYRMIVCGTGSCFLFAGFGAQAQCPVETAFLNLAMACKYDTKVERQVAVGVWKQGKTFRFRWCLIDAPWVYMKEVEDRLKGFNPFGELKQRRVSRY